MSKIVKFVKLQVLSGMANPSPPVGPVLGQNGLNIMNFCKMFNDQTNNMEKGIPLPVIITVYSDRNFTFIIKTPPVSVLLKKKLSLDKGSSKPGSKIISYIKKLHIIEIAKLKYPDMNSNNINSISLSIIGTARSMGILVKE